MASAEAGAMTRSEEWRKGALLWLAGNGLRLTILAMPPLLPLVQADLRLSGTEIGLLSGLPIVLFGLAALPGALLIARLGALRALCIGLLITGIGSALRGVGPSLAMLYFGTIITGAGVAVMQPAFPPLVRQWLPHRIGFATALYTNGLLVGETLPAAFTVALMLPLAGGYWGGALALWGGAAVLLAAIMMVAAPRADAAMIPANPRWWPNWRDRRVWRLGFIVSSVNSLYFCTNFFLPGHLQGAGRPDLVSAGLTALNLGQVPASFLMLAIASRLERRVSTYVFTGVAMLIAVIGIALTANVVTIICAAAIGFFGAIFLTMALTLPSLLAAPQDTARLSAAMFTISYSIAMVVSLLAGAAWDLTGDARFAFLPIALSSLPAILLAPALNLTRHAD